MRLDEFYIEFLPLIFAVHIFCAVIWVGGMLFFTINVYPSVLQIPNEKMFVRTSIRTLVRFFRLLTPVTLLLGASGFLMAKGGDFAHKDPVMSIIVTTKEFIWLFMFSLYLFAFYKIKEARQRCLASDSEQARDNIKLVSFYVFTISSLLGLCAIYFGFMLRGI